MEKAERNNYIYQYLQFYVIRRKFFGFLLIEQIYFKCQQCWYIQGCRTIQGDLVLA